MSGSDPPPDRSSPAGLRCPRCGGAAGPRRGRDAKNPFLVSAATREITCEDCGLDFDPQTESGRAPWSRP